jgi:carboxyl-terminal processing protease
MKYPSFAQRRPFLVSAVLAVLIMCVAGGSAIYVFTDPGFVESLDMMRAAMIIDRFYEYDVNWDRMAEDGMRGMFGRLDRYSGYVAPKRWDRMYEELSGSYTGIGVTVVEHDRGLMIMSVREDGPAAAAGMLNGDIVVRIDTVDIGGLNVYESTDVLRGPEDTEVKLTLYRPVVDDTLSVSVTRRKIDFVHIPYAGYTPDSAIYVRLLDFDAGASEDLRQAIDSLLADSPFEPSGLILDLRGNPGGLFVEAYGTANLFLEAGKFIVGTDGRSRWNDERHYSSDEDITDGMPMVVLVDNGSASASEIVAGSLHQLGRAILVGDTTFGKGLVQGYRRLYDGSGVRLTVSRYYLEGDLYLNEFDSALEEIGHGLVPDVLIEMPERRPFVHALERSLLLNKFAELHQDEIVGSAEHFGLDDSWVERFRSFARAEGFEYASSITEAAESLGETAKVEEAGTKLRRAVADFLESTRASDHDEFEAQAEYIKLRLAQTAMERRYGLSAAYRVAIVPNRPDIRAAEQVLRHAL